VESDPDLAATLHNGMDGSKATVLCGDGAALEPPDSMFDSAVCFMMLSDVPASSLRRKFRFTSGAGSRMNGAEYGLVSRRAPIVR
jgi:hypothetical protein